MILEADYILNLSIYVDIIDIHFDSVYAIILQSKSLGLDGMSRLASIQK
jgi:hypothetical protein